MNRNKAILVAATGLVVLVAGLYLSGYLALMFLLKLDHGLAEVEHLPGLSHGAGPAAGPALRR